MTSLCPLRNFLESPVQPFCNTDSHLKAQEVDIAMSDRVKEAVLTEAKDVKAASQDVVKSGTYLYPFKVSKPLSMKSV